MKRTTVVLVTVAVMIVVCGAWRARARPLKPRVPVVYSVEGFGGMVAAATAVVAKPNAVEAAYNAGRYAECEAKADAVIAQEQPTSLESLRARQLAAYSAARRGKFGVARSRFELLRDVAEERPDHGKEPGPSWDPQPTYEQEGDYEAAVCTGALGDRAGAEERYNLFVARFPVSVLAHAAVVRVARYHKNDLPKRTVLLWNRAERMQKAEAAAKAQEEAMCGPDCLAELLKRRGMKADAHRLAERMGLTEDGSSMAALAKAAKQRGLALRGLMLSQAGLRKETLPVIALVRPGHYILVESARADGVTVWDPDGLGLNRPAERVVPLSEWSGMWDGAVLGR